MPLGVYTRTAAHREAMRRGHLNLPKRDLRERFDEKFIVEPNTGCYIWISATNPPYDYGVFAIRHGHAISAHRAAWEIHVGPIPEEMWVLHHCDFPRCVNWEKHLYLGDHAANMADLVRRKRSHWLTKTHCPDGHPYEGENLRIYQGRRYCITCTNRRARAQGLSQDVREIYRELYKA